jgi:SAM-dependent methyltransferase
VPAGGATRYDEFADSYVRAVGDDVSDSVAADLLEQIGEVRRARVLDLACGHGRMSRELARRGATVVSVDISTKLLDKARVVEDAEPLGIEYARVDVASPDALADEIFEGVVCHFGLSDIDELEGALATVSRVLEPGGWFVFSIVHPCFPGFGPDAPSSWPPGRGYYAEGWWLADNPGFRGQVGANHRTLGTYLNELRRHGLSVEHVSEPEGDKDWLEAKHADEAVPLFLVVRCAKATA